MILRTNDCKTSGKMRRTTEIGYVLVTGEPMLTINEYRVGTRSNQGFGKSGRKVIGIDHQYGLGASKPLCKRYAQTIAPLRLWVISCHSRTAQSQGNTAPVDSGLQNHDDSIDAASHHHRLYVRRNSVRHRSPAMMSTIEALPKPFPTLRLQPEFPSSARQRTNADTGNNRSWRRLLSPPRIRSEDTLPTPPRT